MIRRILKWLVSTVLVLATFELISRAVSVYLSRRNEFAVDEFDPSYSGGLREQFTSFTYPEARVDVILYSSACALLICIILALIVFLLTITVMHFSTLRAPVSQQSAGGMTVTKYRTAEEKAQLSRSYLLNMSSLCMAILTFCLLLRILFSPAF